MKIYLIRHMEAEFPAGMVSDKQRWDAYRPPTETGKKQTKILLGDIRDIRFKQIIHSGVLRTEHLALQLPMRPECEIHSVPELYDPDRDQFQVDYAVLWAAYLQHGPVLKNLFGNSLAHDAIRTHARKARAALNRIFLPAKDVVAIVGHNMYLAALALEIVNPENRNAVSRIVETNMSPCGRITIALPTPSQEIVEYIPMPNDGTGWRVECII